MNATVGAEGIDIQAFADETIPPGPFPESENSWDELGDGVEPSADLAAHNFPATPVLEEEPDEDLETWREDLWLYRNRTQTMLRRYLRYSLETGRVPSILGREFFRSKVSSYTVATFEDRVIFVYDMERSIEMLDGFSRELLTRVVLQEHHPEDIRRQYAMPRRSIYRRLEEALDELSGILLNRRLLTQNMSE